ncbi:hypothetical protein Q066_05466 [Pseudomonas aeruginosa BL12]|uniref:hypothetical protein n=1 Tax=Pseudomonas aeruginosa TaxID=287 RepID=UPI0003B9FA8A|nr:hypothetical protein [Pseudomonas aeruginosa]UVD41306.1 hypothetical protein [Pseudomonas phage vB_Pae_HB2107-3I]ERY32181.1 hypothetical protein Q066_05466 [Pseudomonas aeruginosa BL12]MBN0050763.1 hypothetical protein [Pseudomonas aeruginosa]MBN0561508.1 hypothetical protein [Pseudomonas aeruginosa]MBN0670520.1 hypothetical protein [Pseudomonas aeruginosa]
MNDRELLELAARAAGIPDALYLDCVAQDMYHPRDGEAGIEVNHRDTRWSCLAIDGVWNPRDDDGDALRLAVRLNMDIRYESYDSGVAVIVGGAWDGAPEAVHEIFERDGPRATRRAIVRAAAEIGKSMGGGE